MSLLAVAALLALAWFVLGPDSAVQLAIATAVALIAIVVWTTWRERKRALNFDDSSGDERRVDPGA